MERRHLGQTADNEPVHEYTLAHGRMRARILTYGGIVRTLEVPDAAGAIADVVLGFDALDGYLGEHPYFGALIGRYANRIAGGRFRLEGRAHELPRNDGPNTLHGGRRGFDAMVWEAVDASDRSLVLRRVSPDGEEGFPGTLTVEVRYAVTDEHGLRIDYRATTDAPTVLNLTNHAYFHLGGAGAGDVLDHEVEIRASRFTPVDSALIPTGELRPVDGTPLDLRRPVSLRTALARIGDDDQLRIAGGIDHNLVLDGASGALRSVAVVRDPRSGRRVEVWTDQPGIQLYTGNFLDGSLLGKGGAAYPRHGGMCLETQHFPDSPNHPTFPSTRLDPGQTFRSATEYRFSAG